MRSGTLTYVNDTTCVDIRGQYYWSAFLLGPRLRLMALRRCASLSASSIFSSSCFALDFGSSLPRSFSSALPTESLVVSAIQISCCSGRTLDDALDHHGRDACKHGFGLRGSQHVDDRVRRL